MSIKDLPHVTVEQVLALRKAAIELEQQLADLKASLPKVRAYAFTDGAIWERESSFHKDIEIEAEAYSMKWMQAMSDYANIIEVRDMLNKLIEQGYGEYELVCNREYAVARKDEVPDINNERRDVSLGGYC